jgi:hypothetical protein
MLTPADAKSYQIELTIESRTSSEFSTSWRKQNLRAEQAPRNSYRFEGQSSDGSGIVVSDGVTEWNLNRIYGEYTKRPPGTYGHPFPKVGRPGEAITRSAFFRAYPTSLPRVIPPSRHISCQTKQFH